MVPWKNFKELLCTDTMVGVKGRCIRKYTTFQKDKNEIASVEAILQDDEGTNFLFTIQKSLIHKFDQKIEEGEIYSVLGFAVSNYSDIYRITSGDHKGKFTYKTLVRSENISDFPLHAFHFKTFDEIMEMKDPVREFPFDVIGRVLHMPENYSTVWKRNNQETKILELILEDSFGKTIKCTLWEKFAEKALELFYEKKPTKDDILIIQFVKATMFRGIVSVSNTFHATSLLLNIKCDAVEEFRKRHQIENHNSECTDIYSTPLAKKEITCSIREFCEDTEGGTFWITGIVVNIDTSGSWYYVACKFCPKKLAIKGNDLHCLNCGKTYEAGIMRYKIIMDVADISGSCTFVVWDKEAIQVIGKTAGEVTTTDLEDGGVPLEIEEAFLHKKFKCKIITKGDSWKQYSVKSITVLDEDENSQKSMSSSLIEYSIGLLETSNMEKDMHLIETSVQSLYKEPNSTITEKSMDSLKVSEGEAIKVVLDVDSEFNSVKRKLDDEFSATKLKRSVRIKTEKKRLYE